VARWRLRHAGPGLRHQLDADGKTDSLSIAGELRREGIVVRPSAEFLSGLGQERVAQLQAAAHRLWNEARTAGAAGGQPAAAGPYPGKEYKTALLPQELSLDDPFVRFALDRDVLRVAKGYLGVRPFLRAIELWWDRPTPGGAKETQLWHKDGDDVLNVKIFLYLNDVDDESGPFCFIPRTHPLGSRGHLIPGHDAAGRSTDEQMASIIPASDWQICAARAGAVILCDTCGYHKGLKPTRKERLLFMAQYTSKTPQYPRTLRITGARAAGLSPIEQEALGWT